MTQMKRESKKLRSESFLTSLSMIAVGILFIIFPENSGKMICYVTGCVLLAWGVIKLVMYFVSDVVLFGSYSLVGAVALIMGGTAALLKPEFFAGILPTIFGCVLVIDGVLKLQYSFDLLKVKSHYWWMVLLSAVFLSGLGLLIVFNPWDWVKFLMIFTGIILTVNGIFDIIVSLYIDSIIRKMEEESRTLYLDESQYQDKD
jgi:uncharacterized membrane protein HdeD (DUF308 family)